MEQIRPTPFLPARCSKALRVETAGRRIVSGGDYSHRKDGRKDFEELTHHRYDYVKGLNGHSEIALYVDTFEEVDVAFRNAVANGAKPVLEPETEPWGQNLLHCGPGRESD